MIIIMISSEDYAMVVVFYMTKHIYELSWVSAYNVFFVFYKLIYIDTFIGLTLVHYHIEILIDIRLNMTASLQNLAFFDEFAFSTISKSTYRNM